MKWVEAFDEAKQQVLRRLLWSFLASCNVWSFVVYIAHIWLLFQCSSCLLLLEHYWDEVSPVILFNSDYFFSGLEGWICTIQRGKHKNKIEHGGQVCYNYHMISASDVIFRSYVVHVLEIWGSLQQNMNNNVLYS